MPRHHSYVARMLVTLFAEGGLPNVESVEVEPEFGQVARVAYRGGGLRLVKGNDVGLNSWAAIETLRDKEFTKFLLRSSGYRCPAGRTFALPWWAGRIGPSLARRGYDGLVTTADAVDFAMGLGFPVYSKPVDGAHGTGVERCHDATEIEEAIARYEVLRVKTMLVEEAIDLPDYRIVVLDDEVISAYRRRPLAVGGDGVSHHRRARRPPPGRLPCVWTPHPAGPRRPAGLDVPLPLGSLDLDDPGSRGSGDAAPHLEPLRRRHRRGRHDPHG